MEPTQAPAPTPAPSLATVPHDTYLAWEDWAHWQVLDWADSLASGVPGPVMVEATDLVALALALALSHGECCTVLPARWEMSTDGSGEGRHVPAVLIGPCEQAYLDLDDLMVTHCRPVCQLHGFYMVPGLIIHSQVYCKHGQVLDLIRPSSGSHTTPDDFRQWVIAELADPLMSRCLGRH